MGRSLGLLALWILAMPALARPVMVEIFVSSQSADSQKAVKAVVGLRSEFSPDEVHFLVYSIDSFEGALRAVYYGVKSSLLPVAIFNGTSRIEGSLPNLSLSYRQQIVEKQRGILQGDIQCWVKIGDHALITSATAEIASLFPTQKVKYYYALLENRLPDQPGIVLAFDFEDWESLSGGYATILLDRYFDLHETQAEIIWWIENSVSKEILHSSRAVNIAPFQFDTNGDGEWNALDVFLLAPSWQTNDSAADRNKDNIVDANDLLHFITRYP